MNCERFQMVADLARDDEPCAQEGNQRGLMVMAVNERADALAHVAACGPCAQTLSEQKELSESLRSLMEQMQAIQAPPDLELRLLAAHRSRTPSIGVRPSQSRGLYWISAVAAVLLLVLGLMVWQWRPDRGPSQPVEAKSNSGSEPAASSAGVRQSGLVPAAGKSPTTSSASAAQHRRDTPSKRVNKPSRFGRRFAAAQLAKRRREERELKEQQNALAANAEPAEVATDFVPVGYGSAMDLQEGGQLVRVELPRLALASFGLPVNMDRVDERVKADVLVGPDGIARAIRFVK